MLLVCLLIGVRETNHCVTFSALVSACQAEQIAKSSRETVHQFDGCEADN